MPKPLIPKHGGYRRLKTFQLAQLVHDVTARFCDRYIHKSSRTHDQMVQAARSGVQNIAEGSQASGRSKKFELKLTNVARASLEELRLDWKGRARRHRPYRRRQRGFAQWDSRSAIRQELVDLRPKSAEEVALWVKGVHDRPYLSGQGGRSRRSGPKTQEQPERSTSSTSSTLSTGLSPTYPAIAANAALVLINVACSLLDRQIATQAKSFENDGGFTERLYRTRKERRGQ